MTLGACSMLNEVISFYPRTLFEWAGIFTAVGTTVAVSLSLYLTSKRNKKSIIHDVNGQICLNCNKQRITNKIIITVENYTEHDLEVKKGKFVFYHKDKVKDGRKILATTSESGFIVRTK